MRHYAASVAALEDKIAQRAVVEVLNAVYETDFLGFSYGFRPGRSPHHAVDALAVGIERKRVNWVLDTDIRDFFTSPDHGWLGKFLEHRIADKRVLRLLRKWLTAGVIENGNWSQTLEGAQQGASASPLLANVYLHYVLDLWADWWRSRYAHGDVIIVRFADDFIAGFEHQGDAERFLADLRERFAKFALELHPGNTRLIEFGRHAARRRKARRLGKQRRSISLASRTSAGRPGTGASGCAASRSRSGYGPSCGRSKKSSCAAGISPFPSRAGGWEAWCEALRPLRRARQQRCNQSIPHPGGQALVPGAATSQPAHPPELETHGPPRHPVAAPGPDQASMAERAIRRPHPRREPSAVVPLAGICAGGRPQGRSLPRPFRSVEPGE